MAEDPKNTTTAQEPTTGATEPPQASQEPEPTTTQGNEPGSSQDATEPQTDRHGQPGIAKGKYERDIAAKDKEIEALKAKVAEAAKTEEGREKLTQEVEALKAELEDLTVTHKLELAGCRSTKAAKALLPDYEGDVSKLMQAEPWLFEADKPKGKVGAPPAGAASDMESRRAKARADLGLPPKKS